MWSTMSLLISSSSFITSFTQLSSMSSAMLSNKLTRHSEGKGSLKGMDVRTRTDSSSLISQPIGHSHNSSGKLPLLSGTPTVTFLATELMQFGQYQIILLSNGGTYVWTTCPQSLHETWCF